MPVSSRYSVDTIEGFPLPDNKKIEEILEGRRLFDHFLRERKMPDELTLKRRNEILDRLSSVLERSIKKMEEISEGRRLFDHFLRERKMPDKWTLKRRNEILDRLSTFLRTLRMARSTI